MFINELFEGKDKPSLRDPKDNPCWKGYHPVGTKKKNGRTVPNCVPNANEGVAEGFDRFQVGDKISFPLSQMATGIVDKIDDKRLYVKLDNGEVYTIPSTMLHSVKLLERQGVAEESQKRVPWDAVVDAIVYDQFDTLMNRYGLTFDDIEHIVQQHGFASSDDVRAEYSQSLEEAYDTSPDNREYFDNVQEWAQAVKDFGADVIKARGVYVAHGWYGEAGEFDPAAGEGWLVDRVMRETSDYFRRREREEAIISGKKPARKKSPAQTSDYARRREQEKKQGVAEEKKGLYYYVNKRKKAGISRDKDHPKAPTAQAWKDAAKTAKKESVSKEYDIEVRLMEMRLAGYKV